MEPRDLVKVWTAPDNTKLTPRQMSIRLPLHVAAKLSALCEMFPKKTRTEILGDLLSTALDQLAQGLSEQPSEGELADAEAQGLDPRDIAEGVWGDRARYDMLVQKYEKELEHETGQTTDAPDAPQGKRIAGAKKVLLAQRAPRGRGATPPTTQARPAEGPRGDQPGRKRGGRRRPMNG
jgi:hypothetical protein